MTVALIPAAQQCGRARSSIRPTRRRFWSLKLGGCRSTSLLRWMVAKSQSPVENGGKNPIIYRVSTCFNHPLGDAGFRWPIHRISTNMWGFPRFSDSFPCWMFFGQIQNHYQHRNRRVPIMGNSRGFTKKSSPKCHWTATILYPFLDKAIHGSESEFQQRCTDGI